MVNSTSSAVKGLPADITPEIKDIGQPVLAEGPALSQVRFELVSTVGPGEPIENKSGYILIDLIVLGQKWVYELRCSGDAFAIGAADIGHRDRGT
jgi:hypothetical protein